MPCTVRTLLPLAVKYLDLPIPSGTVGTLNDDGAVTFLLTEGERTVRLNPYRLFRFVEVVGRGGEGIPVEEPPDREELERIILDSMCPSITGHDVEPDGHDPHGAPSWMLVLGLV
jgi:hypothetical protein